MTPPHAVELEDPPPQPDLELPAPPHAPSYTSKPDVFGVFRQYPRKPSNNELHADGLAVTDDIETEFHPPTPLLSPEVFEKALQKALYPFPNYSTFLYLHHDYDGIIKSRENRERQLDIFMDPDFKWTDFAPHANQFRQFEAALDKMDLGVEDRLGLPDAWRTSTLSITIPISKVRGLLDGGIRQVTFKVPGLQHRSITAVVLEALRRKRGSSDALHYVPYLQFWKPAYREGENGPTERVVDDLYTSEAWLAEDAKVQQLPIRSADGSACTLPRALASLMFWSDATQLANFGSAKLWPLYMFLGNQAKIHRAKSGAACHHIAYLPSVSSIIQNLLVQ